MLQNKDLSMIIIVPKEVNGLATLVEGLANYTIGNIVKETREQYDKEEVKLYLPKFKIESTLSLKEPLIKVIFI